MTIFMSQVRNLCREHFGLVEWHCPSSHLKGVVGDASRQVRGFKGSINFPCAYRNRVTEMLPGGTPSQGERYCPITRHRGVVGDASCRVQGLKDSINFSCAYGIGSRRCIQEGHRPRASDTSRVLIVWEYSEMLPVEFKGTMIALTSHRNWKLQQLKSLCQTNPAEVITRKEQHC